MLSDPHSFSSRIHKKIGCGTLYFDVAYVLSASSSCLIPTTIPIPRTLCRISCYVHFVDVSSLLVVTNALAMYLAFHATRLALKYRYMWDSCYTRTIWCDLGSATWNLSTHYLNQYPYTLRGVRVHELSKLNQTKSNIIISVWEVVERMLTHITYPISGWRSQTFLMACLLSAHFYMAARPFMSLDSLVTALWPGCRDYADTLESVVFGTPTLAELADFPCKSTYLLFPAPALYLGTVLMY